MKTLRTLFVLLALCGAAFAWPACSGQWVSVPKGTTGGTLYSTGDLLFQCQPKTPPPATNPSSNSSSTANSTSTSTSTSSSNATANQKQTQSQNQLQTQIATGGNAEAANNGNNSNNSVTNIEAAKIPVMTAYAPSVFPTVVCSKGFSGGVQTGMLGISGSGGKIDENCAILEAAGRARTLLAYCKVYITNKYVKKAGVTLEECMATPPPAPVVIPPPPSPTVIVVPITAPQAYQTNVDVTPNDLASCEKFDNICKAQLDEAVLFSKYKSEGQITVVANVKEQNLAASVRDYLKKNGVNSVLTQLNEDTGPGVNVLYVN